MFDSLPLDKVPSTLGASWRHWERQQAQLHGKETMSRLRAVTIAREAGAPDEEVANELERRLGWPAFNHELIDVVARRMGLSTRQVETVDEQHGGWLAETFEALLAVPTVRENVYVCQLIETIEELAAKGECIFVGRGAAHILPVETTFRVRLVAPLRMGLGFTDAKRRIETTDQRRLEFIRSHFQRDPREPQHYDLAINFSRYTAADCAEMVIDAMHRMEAARFEAVAAVR
jgi:cytidylate kinase